MYHFNRSYLLKEKYNSLHGRTPLKTIRACLSFVDGNSVLRLPLIGFHVYYTEQESIALKNN